MKNSSRISGWDAKNKIPFPLFYGKLKRSPSAVSSYRSFEQFLKVISYKMARAGQSQWRNEKECFWSCGHWGTWRWLLEEFSVCFGRYTRSWKVGLERKFEPGAKRKWKSIPGIYIWRGEEDNWRLQKWSFLSDEALKSLPDFLATVVPLPTPGVIYTHCKPNPRSGYQVQFHLEQFFSIVAMHVSYLRNFLKNIGDWSARVAQ